MKFRVHATALCVGRSTSRHRYPDLREPRGVRKVLAEGNAVRRDPTIPGREIIFNVRERNASAAVVLVGVEQVVSIPALFVSGQDAGADKAAADEFQKRAFAKGGQPDHEALKIEAPGCYMVVETMGNDPAFSSDQMMALTLIVENMAAAFFRDIGVCT